MSTLTQILFVEGLTSDRVLLYARTGVAIPVPVFGGCAVITVHLKNLEENNIDNVHVKYTAISTEDDENLVVELSIACVPVHNTSEVKEIFRSVVSSALMLSCDLRFSDAVLIIQENVSYLKQDFDCADLRYSRMMRQMCDLQM
jgi:hypothetical protein